MVIITVTVKGIWYWSNMSNCKTLATKNNLKEAPTTLDIKKATEPVL